MPNWSYIPLFASIVAVLVFTPGPNTLYIMTRSVQQGRKAGVISSVGVQTGTLIHMIFAAFGLSAFVISSAWAFAVVKYAGAIYLLYLGIKTLRNPEPLQTTETTQHRSLSDMFRQGLIVNVLNPKTALFFFAFLPQFIDTARGPIPVQIFFLGLILIFLGTTSDMLVALTAGGLGEWLRSHVRFLRIQHYLSGAVYTGLGLLTAVSG